MAHVAVLVAVLAFEFAVLVVAFFARRPIQHALYPNTGLKEWQATARRLSWSDRWRIRRAVSRGRTVTPRLAPFAVQRARVALAILDTMQRRKYLWWVFGLMTVGIVLLVVGAVTPSGHAHDADPTRMFFAIGLAIYVAAVLAYMPWALRRAGRQAREAIRVNLAQQGELPDLRRIDQGDW